MVTVMCVDCTAMFGAIGFRGQRPLRCATCMPGHLRELNRRRAATRRVRDPEAVRRAKALGRHAGIEPGGVGPCAICSVEAKLVVDHDHACCPSKDKSCGRCFRGYICQNCNHALGHAKDNPDTLRTMAAYLEASRAFA